MSNEIDILLNLWKETRNAINHFDKMMDQGRQRAFLIFATITSAATTLYYTLPEIRVFKLNLSTALELCCIITVIPFCIQNRLYHDWLRKSVITAIQLEIHIKNRLKSMNGLLTQSLSRPRFLEEISMGTIKGYWKTMVKSKLFWIDISLFSFIIILSLILAIIFQCTILLIY